MRFSKNDAYTYMKYYVIECQNEDQINLIKC